MIIDGICYTKSSSWNNILRHVQAKWILGIFYAVAFFEKCSGSVSFNHRRIYLESFLRRNSTIWYPAPAFRKV